MLRSTPEFAFLTSVIEISLKFSKIEKVNLLYLYKALLHVA